MTNDIVARLREIPTAWPLVDEAADEIERLRKERDHARYCACDLFAGRCKVNRHKRQLWYAQQMGWDCFKEETDVH